MLRIRYQLFAIWIFGCDGGWEGLTEDDEQKGAIATEREKEEKKKVTGNSFVVKVEFDTVGGVWTFITYEKCSLAKSEQNSIILC
jgi:hypothetical protein